MPAPGRPTPAQRREMGIEYRIKKIYEEAPVVRTKVREGKRFVFKEYYKPTPEQAEKIVELAEELPPEKREKYIVEAPRPKEEPKGIGEILGGLSVQTPIFEFVAGITGLKGKKKEAFKEYYFEVQPKVAPQLRPVEPIKFVGGVVTSVESAVYGGERLVSTYITHHEPITPRPPPTVTGGVIGTLLGRSSELERAKEYGGEYMAGSILGDILLSYATSWGMGKAWAGAKWVGGKVKAVPYGRYGGKAADFIVSRAPSPFPEMGAVIRYDLPHAVKGSIFWEMGSELREAFPQAVRGSIFYEMAAETYPYLQEAKYLLKDVYATQLVYGIKTYPKQALQSSIFWEMGTEVRKALPQAVRESIFWEMGAETAPYFLGTKELLKGAYGVLQHEVPRAVRGTIFWELGSEWYGLGKEAKMLLKNVMLPQAWEEMKGLGSEVWRGSIFYEMGRDVYAMAKPYYMYTKSVLYPNIMGTVKGYVSPILHTSPFYEMGKELTRFPSVIKSSIFGEMGVEVFGLWKELKYGLKMRAAVPYWWKEGLPHLIEPAKGLRITFGVEDLPYRGLMGPSATKFGVAEHVTRSGSVLLTQQVPKQAVEETAKATLAKTILGVGVKEVAQQIVHPFIWKGEQFPSPYEMKKTWAQLGVKEPPPMTEAKLKLAPYPAKTQKRKQETSPVLEPSPMLKEFLSEKFEPFFGLAPFQAQKAAQAQKQRVSQVQRQRQTVAQYMLPRKRLRRKMKREKKKGEIGWGRYELLYPVATTSQVAKWVFGKRKIYDLPARAH